MIVEALKVTTPDQRILSVERTGDLERGYLVFLMHGSPGSRLGIKPRAIALFRMGVQLISYDRPGYGGSDRQQGRRVVDCAEDVKAIAATLELGRFAIIGRSGGGPHALACAARLGDVVDRVRVLCTPSPIEDKQTWLSNMAPSNVAVYETDEATALADIRGRVKRIQENPDSLLKGLEPELTKADWEVVGDIALRRQIVDSYQEAVKQGSAGWEDDVLAFRNDWGFDLSEITVPVDFWHGEDDPFSPVAHTEAMAATIKNAPVTVDIQPGMSHFNAVQALPEILSGLIPKD